jgi:hypothetical protein
MQYIGFWEFEPKDIEDVIKKYYGFKKFAEKFGFAGYPKPISPSYQIGEVHGFQLFEADEEEQIANLMAFYRPEMKWEFTPIVHSKESIQAYYRTKKHLATPDLIHEMEEAVQKRREEIED